MRFGLSTHLFHGVRLERTHLALVAEHGFGAVEVFATRTHVDYHDAGRLAEIRSWLDELGLDAWSLHLPICDGFTNGVWGRAYSTASADTATRQDAVAETIRAVSAARRLGCRSAILHLGLPYGQPIPANDNDAAAVKRSLEPIAEACEAAGVQLALEVIPNELATASAVLDWLTGDLELGSTAACMDVGHAHLMGGAPDAIDLLSGHIVTTHLHDNRGKTDEHLVPFDGTLDWVATMTAFQKIGYGGPLMFEVPDHGAVGPTLQRMVSARDRIQAILDDLDRPFAFED